MRNPTLTPIIQAPTEPPAISFTGKLEDVADQSISFAFRCLRFGDVLRSCSNDTV